MEVDLLVARGVELDLPLLRRLDGGRGERRHLHEPLPRQVGLDHGVAARAVPDRHGVGLDLLQIAGVGQRRDHALAGLEAVQAGVGAGGGGHVRGVVDDLDLGQVVAAAGLFLGRGRREA